MKSYTKLTLSETDYDPEEGWHTAPITLAVCDRCGSTVVSTTLHDEWHELIRLNRVIE
jgi:hypothetical protein